MKLLLLCSFLLPSVLSTSFGSNSVVITSEDVWNGRASTSNLLSGGRYRVYAVYASSAPSNNYASNVVIKGADNTQFTVASLSRAKGNSMYFLDETIVLTAPITITDYNSASGARVSYSVYIVSATYPVAPVVSAQLVNGVVDCSLAKMNAPSCTVLSAETNMLLSAFDTSKVDYIDIKNAGFDAVTAVDYNMMNLEKQAAGSSIVISGPLATLHNPAVASANFGFYVTRNGGYSGTLPPGASTTLMSTGFLEVGEAYSMPINQNTLTRNYDFGREIAVAFHPAVGNYYPDQGDSIKFSCVKATGATVVYDCGENAGSVLNDRCKAVSLKVVVGTRTVQGTRFMVQIETTAGAFSYSIYVLLIVSVFGVLQ